MHNVELLCATTGTSPAVTTAVNYVLQFYPLWFSHNQFQHSPASRFFGPDRISPIFQSVVAVNDDTLYAIAFVDLAAEPIILTIPETKATYSLLTMDPYGDIFTTDIPSQTPGTFALIGTGFSGTLPADITPIVMPINISLMIFRADKFSAAGEDQIAEADLFRRSLNTQALCKYENVPCPDGVTDPVSGESTLILPETDFSLSLKQIADSLVASDPIEFLKQLQTAVGSPLTPPLSAEEKALSSNMNGLLSDLNQHRGDLISGVQAAHEAIVSDYLSHKLPGTEWIHFSDIGSWGSDIVGRAAIAEYFLYGNDIKTAAYYHAFHSGNGLPLDGSKGGYVFTFPADNLPEAKRFWSVTAYTPDTIELIRNAEGKYVVASYTPGLVTNPDGSVSIYMATDLPAGVPRANWLPISHEPFNIVLRVYGPEGNVASGKYVPPVIQKLPQNQ